MTTEKAHVHWLHSNRKNRTLLPLFFFKQTSNKPLTINLRKWFVSPSQLYLSFTYSLARTHQASSSPCFDEISLTYFQLLLHYYWVIHGSYADARCTIIPHYSIQMSARAADIWTHRSTPWAQSSPNPNTRRTRSTETVLNPLWTQLFFQLFFFGFSLLVLLPFFRSR